MSFNEPPQRSRSTPIPDPDGAGLPLQPPTPAQFLGSATGAPPPPPPAGPWGQPAPAGGWQPPAGPTVIVPQAPPPGSGGSSESPPRRDGRGPLPWILGIVGLAIAGVVAYVVIDNSNDTSDAAEKRISEITVPTFTVPEITVPQFTVPDIPAPDITAPDFSVPDFSVPEITAPDVTVPDITAPDFTVPDFTVPDVSVPDVSFPDITAPDFTVPEFTVPDLPGGPGAPDGPAPTFADGAPSELIGQLDAELPGEPTQFNVVVIYPDYAIASASDPSDPDSALGAMSQAGTVIEFPGIPILGGTTTLFTAADVDWDAIPDLVEQAPDLLGLPDNAVTHVIVQRWAFEPGADRPLRILVYVDGGGAGYVEADAEGTVLATH